MTVSAGRPRHHLWIGCGLGGLALELAYLRIAGLGDLRQYAETFLMYATTACCLYLGIVWLVVHRTPHIGPSGRWLLWSLIGAGLAFRLTLIGLTPTLSDDMYRYVWDGRVQAAGINPYHYAPADAALAWLRTPEWALINHKDIPTIYPPLMQAAFHAATWIAPTIFAQKLFFLACDVGIVLLLPAILPRWGVSPLMSLIYTWHPLVVIEVAGSGHNDPLGILWCLVGLWLWQGRSRVVATASFAMTFLAKFATVLLVPWYAIRARKLLLVFVGLILVGGLSCWGSPHFTPGLGHYSRQWEFNSSLYRVLLAVIGQPLVVRLISFGLLMGLGVWLATHREDLVTYTLTMLQAAILLTPVVEPWYLLWIVPLLCLRLSWMWLVFSGLVMLSYAVLPGYVRHGTWRIPGWVAWVEYGPLYAWLVWRCWRWIVQKAEARSQKLVFGRGGQHLVT